MNILSAWKDSLLLLAPNNFKIFIQDLGTNIVETYKLLFKYFWWYLLIGGAFLLIFGGKFILDISTTTTTNALLGTRTLTYNFFAAKYFIQGNPVCHISSTDTSILSMCIAVLQNYCFWLGMIFVVLSLLIYVLFTLICVTASKLNGDKNWKYFRNHFFLFSTFLIYHIIYLLIFMIIIFLMVGSKFNILMISNSYPYVSGFFRYIFYIFFVFPLFTVYLMGLFFLFDTKKYLRTFWLSCKMVIFNFPLFFILFVLYILYRISSQYFLNNYLETMFFFLLPLWFAFFAIVYKNRLQRQSHLYFSSLWKMYTKQKINDRGGKDYFCHY